MEHEENTSSALPSSAVTQPTDNPTTVSEPSTESEINTSAQLPASAFGENKEGNTS